MAMAAAVMLPCDGLFVAERTALLETETSGGACVS